MILCPSVKTGKYDQIVQSYFMIFYNWLPNFTATFLFARFSHHFQPKHYRRCDVTPFLALLLLLCHSFYPHNFLQSIWDTTIKVSNRSCDTHQPWTQSYLMLSWHIVCCLQYPDTMSDPRDNETRSIFCIQRGSVPCVLWLAFTFIVL